MPVSDLDIHRAAHQWIAQHGENATAKAREMVQQMRGAMRGRRPVAAGPS